MRKPMTALLYGNPGAGKTPASLTAPKPLLVLDAEAGTNWAVPDAVEWNPAQHGLTFPDGEVVRVFVRDFDVMRKADAALRTTPGRFRSVVIDSITEVQKRCKDSMGRQQLQQQDWGVLLSQMELLIRGWRDLVAEGVFETLVMTAIAAESSGFYGPDVQGALRKSLPGFVDVVGYLSTFRDANMQKFRGMQIEGDDRFIAKDRTSSAPNGGLTGAYGTVIPSPINLTEMIERIYDRG